MNLLPPIRARLDRRLPGPARRYWLLFVLAALVWAGPVLGQVDRGYTIPMLDLDNVDAVHTLVAQDLDQLGQYLGHPTTVLLDDGQTLIAAFPTGHGKGQLRLMTSPDGGRHWEAMPNPGIELHEVPTLFMIDRPDGGTRLLITTCVPRTGEFRWTWSDDDGRNWTPIQTKNIGLEHGIIVALASFWPVLDADGNPTGWRGVFHDYQFNNYTLDMALIQDADAAEGYRCDWGMAKRIVYQSPEGLERARQAGLCEAGAVHSLDGTRMALLFRPQQKRDQRHDQLLGGPGRVVLRPG